MPQICFMSSTCSYLYRIGHDNSGSFAGWKLSYVEVDALSLRKKLFFPCNMWLAEDEGDGKTERELAPGE